MSTEEIASALLALGAIIFAGLVADTLGRQTRLPRVTLLLLVGLAAGPIGLDLFPDEIVARFPLVAHLALVMVAFLLGGELTLSLLRRHGKDVLIISLVVVTITAGVVAAGLFSLGWSVPVAILLGAIATSTDPAAVADVVHEAGARGPFTRTLLGVVAIDDAWGIVAMSFAMAIALGLSDPTMAGIAAGEGLRELAGALMVGCTLGVPMALLTGRVRRGEPTQSEALGGVLLCGGVALYFEVSFLLAAMTMGVIVANLASLHRRPFRAIEGIEWPFMTLFFVLSGASLELADTVTVASLTVAYVIFRVLGRVAGGIVGSRLASGESSSPTIGVALLPQAGIAIGMALVVSQRIPEVGAAVLSATVAGTVVFEVFGPILTRRIVERSGEVRGANSTEGVRN